MTIGQRIKEARKDTGLTQRELAERSGTATGTIQQYELGKRQPRIEQLQRIASALDVDVNWLMNGYTLEQRDQAWKGQVAQLFEGANAWKEGKARLNTAFDSLNSSGQQEAIKRVEELTEVPRYRRPDPPGTPLASAGDTPGGTDTHTG